MDIINDINIKILEDFDNSYKFIENNSLTNLFKCKIEELPNIIFYGPNGSFKDYYIYYLIKKITGSYNINLKNIQEKISVNNNTVEFNVITSVNYIEINLSNYGIYDRWIITDYIQKMIMMPHYHQKRHIIFIKDLDKVSYNAFMAFRRIMEKYSINALFLFNATNISHINSAILSRVFAIRCPLVSDKEFKLFLSHYIKEKPLLKTIINNSNRNINKAVLLQYNNIFPNTFIPILENKVKEHFVVMKKTKDVFVIAKLNREFLYLILNFNYSVPEIIKYFTTNFMNLKKITDDKLYEVIELAAITDLEVIKSSKDNYCLESYLLKLYRILHY